MDREYFRNHQQGGEGALPLGPGPIGRNGPIGGRDQASPRGQPQFRGDDAGLGADRLDGQSETGAQGGAKKFPAGKVRALGGGHDSISLNVDLHSRPGACP